jgi:hypothetical protein
MRDVDEHAAVAFRRVGLGRFAESVYRGQSFLFSGITRLCQIMWHSGCDKQ